MDGGMDGRMDGRTGGRMDGRTGGGMDSGMDGNKKNGNGRWTVSGKKRKIYCRSPKDGMRMERKRKADAKGTNSFQER